MVCQGSRAPSEGDHMKRLRSYAVALFFLGGFLGTTALLLMLVRYQH